MPGPLNGKSVLVTGATGFIGPHLVRALLRSGAQVSALVRNASRQSAPGVHAIIGDLSQPHSLAGVCRGIDTIFHAAGYAHAWAALSKEDDRVQRRVNVDGTGVLMDEADQSGVRRFIFFSSVKAMGEGEAGRVDESWNHPPDTSYGQAKLEAERRVLEEGRKSGMHVCNLRLALVYGPSVKGNLQRMIEAIERGRFPPLPETGNKRSMVHVEDVVQAALLAATSPRANGQTYIVTDGRAYSTRDIYLSLCWALGKRPPRWLIPAGVLRGGAKMGDLIGGLRGRRFVFDSDAYHKLLGSAWYSNEKIRRELSYQPTRTFADSVGEMVEVYRLTKG